MISTQSPGHITGFFKIYKNGSTGAGINIEEGMKTTVSKAKKDEFFLNGKKEKLPVSEKTLKIFREKNRIKEKVKIEHKTPFPIGFGLGLSGAGALSLTIALNELFLTKMKKKEIIEIAKRAEIESGTGLGDVIAEQYSGFLIGTKPYPSQKAKRLKCTEKYLVLGFFGPIETKKIIKSKKHKEKINKIGTYCMKEFEEKKTMKNFIHLNRVFSVETEIITKRIGEIMDIFENSGMAMLGETIFIPTSEPQKVKRKLSKYCKTQIAKIAEKGAGE